MDRFRTFIEKQETADIGPGLWLSVVLSIILVRDFLEHILSFRMIDSVNAFHFLHFPVFFLSILLAVCLLLHFFSGSRIERVCRAALIFFPLIVLPVLIDGIRYLVSGKEVSYLYLTGNLRYNFLNMLNPWCDTPDIPAGIRVEAACVFLFSFLYTYAKRRNLIAGLAAGVAAFLAVFFYISLPGLLCSASRVLSFLPAVKSSPAYLDAAFITGPAAQKNITIVELFLALACCGIWLYRYDRRKFAALAGNLRISRSLHYIFLTVLGIVTHFAFFVHLKGLPESFSILRFLGMSAAIFFAFQFSVVVNDIFDLECDRLSNPERPYVKGVFQRNEYLQVAFVYLAFALLFAFQVSDICFILTVNFIALYFIYSVPPFQLKRFLGVSAAVIAGEALLAFLTGYMFLDKAPARLFIPPAASAFIFTVFFLAAGIKDLKDRQGDKACGVLTLPVLLGEEKGRKATAFLVLLSYFSVPFFTAFAYGITAPVFTYFSIIYGLFNFFYIKKEKSQENVIFLLYFFYLSILLTILSIKNFFTA